MREFLLWFSAGLSCYLIWGVLLEAGVSPQPWPRRSGMWCWCHGRSWECFAFLFLAVVRWLPARRKDNSFQRRKKRGGKEQFIIKLLWRRHFYSEPKLKLEAHVLHSDAARMLNTVINDCNRWAIWLFTELKFWNSL